LFQYSQGFKLPQTGAAKNDLQMPLSFRILGVTKETAMAKTPNDHKLALEYEGESGDVRNDAFHGTTLQNALKIKEQGFLPRLGIAGLGCYFDLGSDVSARAFALERADGDLEQAVVIRAELHLGKTLDISFKRNPEIKGRFQEFQAALQHQLGVPYELTFNDEKEKFLQEYYPDVTAVLYFNERTGIWYVAIRDPKRIRIFSMTTLAGKEI
jgi:hypothetical protein